METDISLGGARFYSMEVMTDPEVRELARLETGRDTVHEFPVDGSTSDDLRADDLLEHRSA